MSASGAATALHALLVLVLVDLARAAGRSRAVHRAGTGDDPGMERIRRTIDRRFAEDLRVSELADLAGCSPEHLARRFARYVGCPPNRYLRLRRIQEAMAGLRAGHKRILDLALACGFNDLTNFNRAFRSVAETTPREYRRRFATQADQVMTTPE
jgi:AraC-like DNA-binding protein